MSRGAERARMRAPGMGFSLGMPRGDLKMLREGCLGKPRGRVSGVESNR